MKSIAYSRTIALDVAFWENRKRTYKKRPYSAVRSKNEQKCWARVICWAGRKYFLPAQRILKLSTKEKRPCEINGGSSRYSGHSLGVTIEATLFGDLGQTALVENYAQHFCAHLDFRHEEEHTAHGQEPCGLPRRSPMNRSLFTKSNTMKNLSKFSSNNCPDCCAEPGDLHEAGCALEFCSSCHNQRLQCDCLDHDPGASVWTGEHPESTECKKRGWYAVDTEIGVQPCGPGMPGAFEDISRLRFFRHHGFDGVYGQVGMKCDACGGAAEDEVYSTVIT